MKFIRIDDDTVLAEAKPSIRSYIKLLLLGIILTPLIVGFFILLYIYLDRRGKAYVVTGTRVVARYGILSKNEDEVSIRDIRSLQVKRGWVDRIFGCGNIYVGTSGTEGYEVIITGISKPQEFKEIISNQKAKLTLGL